MVMMEEFRRRKNLKDYYGMMAKQLRKSAEVQKLPEWAPMDMEQDTIMSQPQHHGSNAERFFEPGRDELFDADEFTLIFMDSDSVTNVTSLNRVNQRRVLIFIGNGNGLVTYGKGKAEEYEQAFDNALKKAR